MRRGTAPKSREAEQRKAEQRKRDLAAATCSAAALSASAVREGSSCALSWESLAGMCRHPDVRYVRIICGSVSYEILRSRLRAMRPALRPFRDVLCWLDTDARLLCLRWRGGRGGLDLRPDLLVYGEDTSSVDVTVATDGGESHGLVEVPWPPPVEEPAPAVGLVSEPAEQPANGWEDADELERSVRYSEGYWRALMSACG